jgi:phosphatidylglycerophosphate synthase
MASVLTTEMERARSAQQAEADLRWLSLSSRELRRIAQPPEYSPSRVDTIYRRWSIYLSVPLAQLGATPNGITIGWIAIGLGAIAGLISSHWSIRVLSAIALEFSYLLDFVDGEVARLTNRRSTIGGFLDLMGHALIKTALPLAVGVSASASTGLHFMLTAGAIGAIAIGVGDSLRFHAACACGKLDAGALERRARAGRALGAVPRSELARGIFELSFESPGLFGVALLGVLFNQLAIVAIYWMGGGLCWMCLKALEYSVRLHQLEIATAQSAARANMPELLQSAPNLEV